MPDLVVLCYHAVSPDWPAALSVRPGDLAEQVGSLARRGYRGATLTDAIERSRERPTVAVTFDDAFGSVLTRAFPILERLGMPATVFAPTRYIGSGEPMVWPGIDAWLETPYRNELLPMTWADLEGLCDAGWEIGSHTRNHPRLTQVDDAVLADELAGSKSDVEQSIGRECRSLAYPYGDADERVIRAVEAAGYAAACTLPVRFGSAAPLAWPRVGVYHADGRLSFALKVSRTSRLVRRSPVGDLVYWLRRRLR